MAVAFHFPQSSCTLRAVQLMYIGNRRAVPISYIGMKWGTVFIPVKPVDLLWD